MHFLVLYSSYQTTYNYTKLQSSGINIKLTASTILANMIGAKYSQRVSNSDCQTYTDLSDMQVIGQYGGNCDGCNWTNWATTVSNYPLVLQASSLMTIDNLLNNRSFPNDPTIKLKAAALLDAIMYDLNNSYTCPSQCNYNGQCVRDKDLNIGICECNRGYTGDDCSIPQPALNGFFCGLFLNGSNPNNYQSYGCNNLKPWQCPSGTMLTLFDKYNGLNMYSCIMLKPNSYVYNGTLCGYADFACLGKYGVDYTCPAGYVKYPIVSEQIPLCVLQSGNNIGAGIVCGGADGYVCNGNVIQNCDCHDGLQLIYTHDTYFTGFCFTTNDECY